MSRWVFSLLILAFSFQNAFAQNAPEDSSVVDFTQIDPIVPQPQLMKALQYLEDHSDEFSNQNYMVLIDYGKISYKKRFYLINLKTGEVESRLVAHGRGSEVGENTKKAVKFSNEEGSEATSLGFYRTAETYDGKHGYSLKLDGLSSTNNNARERAIVIHAANYVIEDMPHAGRSQGCPALAPEHNKRIINLIKNGALIYSFTTKVDTAD